TATIEVIRLVATASTTLELLNSRSKLTKVRSENRNVADQYGDNATISRPTSGNTSATRPYTTIHTAAHRSRRAGGLKAFPPWVTNRVWLPSMTFCANTTSKPKITSGEPAAAAAAKSTGDWLVCRYISVVSTLTPELVPSSSGPLN